jgi:hypothetical protein
MEQSTRFEFDVVVTRSGWAVVSVFVWLRQTKAFLTRTGEPSPSPEALFPLTTFVSWVSSPNHNFGLGNNSRKLSLVLWDAPYRGRRATAHRPLSSQVKMFAIIWSKLPKIFRRLSLIRFSTTLLSSSICRGLSRAWSSTSLRSVFFEDCMPVEISDGVLMPSVPFFLKSLIGRRVGRNKKLQKCRP